MNNMLKYNHGTKLDEKKCVSICSFGLKISINSDEKEFLTLIEKKLPEILQNNFQLYNGKATDFNFYIKRIKKGYFKIFRNGELLPSDNKTEEGIIIFFLNQLRWTIAEFSVSRVFIHAGVVGWKGEAFIFPANSYMGKTTLVAEFLKAGAEYFSDEYALLDKRGWVHPFPKTLSMRDKSGGSEQKEIPFEKFGAIAGKEPLPVGLVLFTEYEKGAKCKPELLTNGQGVLEMISHTMPIRQNPEFSLKVLNKTLNRAIIAKCKRGDAADFVKFILKFVDK